MTKISLKLAFSKLLLGEKMSVELMWLGLVLLIAPVLGAYAKIIKDKRGFVWLTGAGAMYLLAEAFNVGQVYLTEWIPSGLNYGTMIFNIIGLIATFIGALMVASSVFK